MYRPSNRPTVTVIVPFRGDGGSRDRVWGHLRSRWAATGWETITGSCPPGPWVKGPAVADAASRASGSILIVADADVWPDGVGDAVDMVIGGAAWAVPHTDVHRLHRDATAAVLAGGDLGGRLEQRPYRGVVGGGVVVMRRDLFDECPMDARFVGWGQEDQAWGLALSTLAGEPWRSPERLWHLWHEPQSRLSRSTGSMGGRLLLRRYQAASGDRARMRALLAEVGETRETDMGVWVYRNRNNGDTVKFPMRRHRLDRLSNWELIAQPPGPEPCPEAAPVANPQRVIVNGGGFHQPASVDPAPAVAGPVAQGITVAVQNPIPESREDAAKRILDRVALDSQVDLRRPAVNEPKSVWLAYALARGVEGAGTMAKTALIRACS